MMLQQNESLLPAASPAKRALALKRRGAQTWGLGCAARRVVVALGCFFLLLPHGIAEQPDAKAPRRKGEEKPFIRPIAPMGQLFADDEMFRSPWSSFAFHPRPARFRSQPATIPRRKRMNQRVAFGAGHSASVPSADGMSSLEHAFSELATPPAVMPRPNLPVSEPLSPRPPMPSTAISPARASQIQTALVHFGYLTGAPTGTWDADSVAAIRKLQSDHHWQTKFAPDARALIFLGLGPGSSPQ